MFSKRTGWALVQNRFTQVQRELQSAGIPLIDLTISNPTRAGLRYDTRTILDSLRNNAAMDYDPQPKGLLSAREAVAGYYREDHNTVVHPESIVLTTSTSEGYSYVFRLLCNPGDEILVPKPSYPLFEFLADLQDVKLVPYPLIYDHGWQIDFHSLTQAVNDRTRAMVAVHPNNPTGSFVSSSERSALNLLCCDNNLALIVDEV
ncbi:MAG: aminotransferase class I/II-fold pyridoxal phosphate-dependent enzyme, partial [Terriglobales bacterium]